jgi:hypothetical protein
MPHGKGIAVETQYRHEGKDKDAALNHYLSRSYSVAWLAEADFTTHEVDLFGILTAWPHVLPRRAGLEGYPSITRFDFFDIVECIVGIRRVGQQRDYRRIWCDEC